MPAWVEPLIIGGWLAQATSWLYALVRSGRRAAEPGEWIPELLLRGAVVALVVWAIAAPWGTPVPLRETGSVAAATLLLVGHALAIGGRLQLARAWGIGTHPRADLVAPVSSGIYRLVAHPIYLGMSVALLAQLALVQNVPALLLVVSAAVVNPWKITREHRLLRRKQAPGPRGHWLLGVVPAFRRDPLAFLRDAVHTWGDVVACRIGFQRAYLIWRPEHVQQVLQNDTPGGGYSKNVGPLGPMGEVLGRGLVTSTGDEWRRQRQIVQPAFHPRADAMQSLAATVTSAVTEMMAQWRPGAVVDVHGEMMRLAFCVVGETLFGADLREHTVVVRHALEEIQRQSNQRIDALVSLPLWVPTRRNRAFRAAIATLHGVVSNVIARRGGRGALLTELRGSMDERLLRDQIVTLLLAGHENSGNALTWMWYLVARHPAVAERLTTEVEDVLAGRVPSLDDLAHLPYARMIAEETLRLYPPGWVTLRRAEQSDEIGGFAIERGAIIVISQWLTHRHPQHWPDPDVFDPERFAESKSAARHRFAYLAFGGGSRRCVGGGFAIAEMQLVLATVAQRFSFELAPDGPAPAPLPVVSLPPRDGLRMRVRDSSLVRR